VTEDRAKKILHVLRKTFDKPKWVESTSDAFENLVLTVISQNTNDRNTEKAFGCLSRTFKIKPEILAEAEISRIEACLRVGGLYRNKAKTIKHVSKIILEEFHGSMQPILSLPFEESRNELINLPGIGPKTADVVLLFSAKQPTIPVDTHVNRVAKRLGFVPEDGGYEDVRESLQSIYEKADYLDVHVLLIALGRMNCKARHPSCAKCPVNMYCPSKGLWG
jgi:endonuclease-3